MQRSAATRDRATGGGLQMPSLHDRSGAARIAQVPIRAVGEAGLHRDTVEATAARESGVQTGMLHEAAESPLWLWMQTPCGQALLCEKPLPSGLQVCTAPLAHWLEPGAQTPCRQAPAEQPCGQALVLARPVPCELQVLR